jgi:subtilisin family serine protease
MDATQWGPRGIAILFMAALAAGGCSPEKGQVSNPNINGQACTTKIKAQSFLVKWNKHVPPQFENNRIRPGSLVTRFSGMDKSQIEENILKKHLSEYSVAEHEFYVADMKPQAITACGSPSLPAAWGVTDIETSEAWSLLQTQGENVTVAVIDSGTDIDHPLLSGQIWRNSRESVNGVDDDRNGLIDDVNGWNFSGENSNVRDDVNHGTHVSGVIVGQPGQNGFVGVAPGARLMPLKFIDADGAGSVGDAVAAIDYAVANGARVINASWGGAFCSDILKQDIAAAVLSGTVFVNASGNRGRDLNKEPEWPAAFQIPGKITVGAYNSAQFLSAFSNYGVLVDVAAPGESILSTVAPAPGQSEGQMCDKTGTSMATPFVSGVAALLISARPSLTAIQVVEAINSSVITGRYGVRTGGKINAHRAAQWILSH